MEWIWDERKAKANFAKHGVMFETASSVFDDPLLVSVPDTHPEDDRWKTVGRANSSTLVVIHTMFEADSTGRIISARLATPSERRNYEALRF